MSTDEGGVTLPSHRVQAVFGAVAVAAVLGGGAYLITSAVDGKSGGDRPLAHVGMVEPVVAGPNGQAPAAPQPAGQGPAGPGPGATANAVGESPLPVPPSDSGSPAPADSPTAALPSESLSVEEQIKRAHELALKHPPRRPLTAAPGLPTGPVEQSSVGSLDSGGTMRVTTARYDLTGQRELLWASGADPVGDAVCTQTFRFDTASTPAERPTMLLCWKTSATRSVLVLSVVKTGRPSAPKAVALLDQKWAGLR